MNPIPPSKSLRTQALLLLGIGSLLAMPLRADLNSDLAFSAFSNVDLNALDGGQVLQARGGLLSFERGITAQALFIINASPAEVQQKLVNWDPSSHAELKVWIHRHLPAKPTAADFADLATLPDNGSVNYQLDATAKLDPNNPALQLDKAEAQLLAPLQAQNLDKKTLYVNFWSQVLAGRIDSLLNGKFAASNYSVSGGDIQSLNEIKSLLHSDTKVYIDYQKLLSQTPLRTGKGTSTALAPASLYYDCFDVEGYSALGTGAVFQAPMGNSIQSVDVEYFVNSGIYTTIELEQLWPVTVNGKNETLVWREDLVSTASVSYLHGMERLASTMLMLQDVKQGIDAFRAEFKSNQ